MPKITYNNIGFTITDLDPEPLAKLEKYYKVKVPSAKYTWKYKHGQWDGTVSLANPQGMLTGLLPETLSLINDDVELIDMRGMPPSVALHPTSVNLRDYQYEAVKSAFSNKVDKLGWWPRGILHIATGGGKTDCAVAMYQMNPVPTFFLVHRKDLMFQAQERFKKKYKVNAGLIGAGKWEPINELNIATMQTLVSIANDSKTPTKCIKLWQLMRNCRQVFFDEAHLMASKVEKGNEFTTIAGWFENAYCRWGLTATPFMREQYDNLLLQGITGETLYKIENQELIDAGYLSAPKVKMLNVKGGIYVPKMSPAKMYQKAHRLGIMRHEYRNKLILDEISKGPFPVLCLVGKVEHANELISIGIGLTGVIVLTGKSSNKQRKETIDGVKSGIIKAILATTIFDEGIDLPNIRKVILAGGGKSIVKNLQRVGRGLRTAEDKNTVEIIDFFDNQHWFLKNHSKKRHELWQQQGFETEVI